MWTIGIIIFIVLTWLLAGLTYSEWTIGLTTVSTIVGVFAIGGMLISTANAEASFETSVNGTRYICDRPTYEFDASYFWPGLTLTRYQPDDSLATCYPIGA